MKTLADTQAFVNSQAVALHKSAIIQKNAADRPMYRAWSAVANKLAGLQYAITDPSEQTEHIINYLTEEMHPDNNEPGSETCIACAETLAYING